MTPTIVLLVAGCALILIGLVGGGVTSKWMNVGKVNGPARALAVILGLVLVCAGIAIQIWPTLAAKGGQNENAGQPPKATKPNSPPIIDKPNTDKPKDKPQDKPQHQFGTSFVVGFDFYPNDAVTQTVTVDIDDIRIADLKADRLTPHVAVRATVPSPGMHSYRVVWMAELPPNPNHPFIPALTGTGTVDIEKGSVLSVVTEGTSSQLRLVKMN